MDSSDTDRDIVVRNIADGQDPATTPVKNVMTSQVTTVTPEKDKQFHKSGLTDLVNNCSRKSTPCWNALRDIATTGKTNMEHQKPQKSAAVKPLKR